LIVETTAGAGRTRTASWSDACEEDRIKEATIRSQALGRAVSLQFDMHAKKTAVNVHPTYFDGIVLLR
jgi:hypothetical protein